MSTKYWDLYVYYVKKCVRENYINDIDPNHYEMEWNHFWPKCVAGEWPVGQWLTLKQHAIASALQTLLFKENCMCGWHKSYIPTKLLELAWPFYCEARVKFGMKGAAITHAQKDEFGRSVNAVKTMERLNAEKDEFGRSVQGVKNAERLHAEKDELGRSVQGVKNAERLNAEKDEFGRSVNSMKGGKSGSTQVWQSTVDGFTGNPGNVAQHNRANGWPGDARVRVS